MSFSECLVVASKPQFEVADDGPDHGFLSLGVVRQVYFYLVLEDVGIDPQEELLGWICEYHVLVYHEEAEGFCQLLACLYYGFGCVKSCLVGVVIFECGEGVFEEILGPDDEVLILVFSEGEEGSVWEGE